MKISISENKLEDLKNWFINYVNTFNYEEPDVRQNILLKKQHTYKVCNEILQIGERIGLRDDELRLAETIALFHDIGRFEQYARYHTFVDSESQNHAELGLNILQKFSVLETFDNSVKEVIVQAINYHNQAFLPSNLTNPLLFYAKLIRDADKLDIWRVVIDNYHRTSTKRNGAVELHLPDTPGFSKEIGRDLMAKKIIEWKYVKNLNDFKLLQVGWIFDINFTPTFHFIKKRRYIELIHDVLPKTTKINEILEFIYTYRDQYAFTHMLNNGQD